MIGTKYRNCLQDLPYIISTEKQFIMPPSFRGEDVFKFQSISKKEWVMTTLLFYPIAMKPYRGSSIDTSCKVESGFAGEGF